MWTLKISACSKQSDLPLRTRLPPPLSPHYLSWMPLTPGLQGYTRDLATGGTVTLQIIPMGLTPKNRGEDGFQELLEATR